MVLADLRELGKESKVKRILHYGADLRNFLGLLYGARRVQSCCQTATCLPPSDAQTRRGQVAPGSTGDGHDDPIVAVESKAEAEGEMGAYFSVRADTAADPIVACNRYELGNWCCMDMASVWPGYGLWIMDYGLWIARVKYQLSDPYSSLLEG
jgi:hypothetical protein